MAIKLLLGLLAFNVVAAYPQVSRANKYSLDGRIVGGVETNIEKYPYVVSVWTTDNDVPEFFMCGGTILSNDWIISAGHCVIYLTADVLFIRAGNKYKTQGTKTNVTEIIIHPSYIMNEDSSVDYDISLMKLQTPFVYSPTIQPTTLPSTNTVLAEGTIVTVVGWGYTEELRSIEDALLEISVPTVTLHQCLADNGKYFNNKTMICAGYRRGGKGPCQGDSGGPMLLNSTQVGITSWSDGCAEPNRPAVFTNLAYFRNWVKSQTGV